MGIYSGDSLGLVEGVVFLFGGDLVDRAFLRVVILEGVGVNDFVTGSGAMTCLLIEGEDGTKEEGPIFRTADS